jgi:hypothetical protein
MLRIIDWFGLITSAAAFIVALIYAFQGADPAETFGQGTVWFVMIVFFALTAIRALTRIMEAS